MPERFIIYSNSFLTKETPGFYHCLYTNFRQPGNPDYLVHLKNERLDEDIHDLYDSRDRVSEILMQDIPAVLEECGWERCYLTMVPRSKADRRYDVRQLFLRDAVDRAANAIPNVENGAYCIIRHTNTKTTHIRKDIPSNDGPKPYPGITRETCSIDRNAVRGKNVILFDDIYTRTVNIDEDCIQALYDSGAARVVFYSIGYTREKR